MNPNLLAWQFDLGDRDDGVQVVFAASEGRAMVYAGRQSGGGKGDRSPVTRVPAFDKYATHAGDNPTSADFWDEGYTVTCFECEHRVDAEPCWRCAETIAEETGSEPDDDAIGHPLASNGHVYCSQRCLDRFTARCERVKARKAEAVAALLAKHPFVRVLGTWVGGAGECEGKPEDGFHAPDPTLKSEQPRRKRTCFSVDPENVNVRFKVPGGALSETTADGNAFHNVYCHRCGYLGIARGDYDAFECLAVKPDVIATSG